LAAEGLFVSTQPTPGHEGRLLLIRRNDGGTAWIYPLAYELGGDPRTYRYPAGSGKPDEVYFSQLDTLHVADLRHGDSIDRQELPFPIATSVAAVEDAFFVGSDNGRVYGVDKTRKVETWNHVTGGDLKAPPVMGASSVLFASTDGSVYSLSPSAGWQRGASWKFDTGAPIVAEVVPFSRWVLAGSTDYKLYCLEERDGSVYWSFPAEAPIVDKPVVFSFRPGQDFAYCISVDRSTRGEKRTLFSIKMRDGQMMWRRPGVRSVVTMGKDTLYVLSDPAGGGGRTLQALDVMTGAEKFQIAIDQFHFVPTNLADFGRNAAERGHIYLVAQDGTMQLIGEKL
jgi:outer membrane protein assembly factor BamB